MRRLFLCLPVCLIGLPVLGCLILARTSAVGPGAANQDDAAAPIQVKNGALPDNAGMEKLAKDDPIAFLEYCIAKGRREVKTGYTLTLYKKEVIDGTEYPAELIEVAYREKPYSVYFRWIEGARKAERVMYVEGENKDKKGKSQLLARPSGAFIRRVVGDVVERDVNGPEAKQSGHYTLDDFGFEKQEARMLRKWKERLKVGTIKVEYFGIQNVKELNDRPCFVLRGTTDTPGDDNVAELTSYSDTENWFQTGSILKDKDGKLIGEYYFRDIKLNPEFKKDQFERSALK